MSKTNGIAPKLSTATTKNRGRCRDCTFLTTRPLPGNKSPCSEQGVSRNSKPCGSMQVNIDPLLRPGSAKRQRENVNMMEQLGTITKGRTEAELRALGLLLLGSARVAKAGFSFMQRVFVHYRGTTSDDYVSNWCSAYIVDVDRDVVRLVGRRKDHDFVLSLPRDARILTVAEYREYRHSMQDVGKLIDPAIRKFKDLFDRKRLSADSGALDVDDLIASMSIDDLNTKFVDADELQEKRRTRKRVGGLDRIAKEVESGALLDGNFIIDGHERA